MSTKINRRTFLGQIGGVTAATLAAGAIGVPPLFSATAAAADAAGSAMGDLHDRRWQVYRRRHDAALAHSNLPFPTFPTNGDEELYPTKVASYTKGLPHNELGEVDLQSYTALLNALKGGKLAAFETIPLGGGIKLANPQAAYAFALGSF
jgi:hypothetical protein